MVNLIFNPIKTYFRNKYVLEYRDPALVERVNICLKDKSTPSNCIGAALYIAGVIPHEKVIYPVFLDYYLENSVKLKEPEIGALLIIRSKYDEEVHHVCVFHRTKPYPVVVHRVGETGVVKINPLSKTFQKYNGGDYTFEYVLPDLSLAR